MLRFALVFSLLLSIPPFTSAETVPGRIEAESPFEYYDLTPGNSGDLACGLTMLDAEFTGDTDGTCNIGWTEPGEWVRYYANSASGGAFWLSLRVATNKTQRMIEIQVGGQVQTFEIPRKGWQVYSDIVFPVQLPPGGSPVRVIFNNGGVNLNYLDFKEVTTHPSTVWPLPARVEAEQFINSFDSTGENLGDSICNTGAVDSHFTSDLDGFCDIGWTTAGEWTEYLVSSRTAADYELVLRAASGKTNRKIRVEIDGVNQGDFVVPRLGWQIFSDVKVPISLSKGQHRIRIFYLTGATDLNYLNFKPVPCVEGPGPTGCLGNDDSDGDRLTDDWDICPLEPGLTELRGCAPVFGDFDDDGVGDAEDLCPYSTPGASPPDGCKPIDAVDSDNDGMNNDVDLCETVEGYLDEGCPKFLDPDHDGIRNTLDLCPDDYGVKNQNGCWDGPILLNTDADGDGVGNANDHCPVTTPNAAVGPNGCAIHSELEDRDRDGVNNDKDLCAHSNLNQNTSGHLVDSLGCTGIQAHRRLDDDEDGVLNGIDLCPETPLIADSDPINSLTLFGCRIGELDDDRDGIVESLDSCPTEPGHRLFRGCPKAFVDGDGDIVSLNLDDCPYTPFIADVSPQGCAAVDWEDLDGDGVIDGRDLCPASPAGLLIDGKGCNDHDHLDFDGDGVMNGVDLCPRFAGLVRQNGCGLDPSDADGDGVEEPFDHCPYSSPFGQKDERGCGHGNIEDADGDGASDGWHDDECLNTPITQAAGQFNDWEESGILPNGCSLQQDLAMDDHDLDGVGRKEDLCPETLAGIPVDRNGCPLELDTDRDDDGVPDINDLCPESHKGTSLTPDGCEILAAPRVAQSLYHNLTLASPQLELLTSQVRVDWSPLAPASQPLVWELGEFAWSDHVPIEVDRERLNLEILPLPLRGRDFRIPLRLRVPGTEVVSNWFELVIGATPAPSASLIVVDRDILAASTINLFDTLALLSGAPEQGNSGGELFIQFWDTNYFMSNLGLPFTCDPMTNAFPFHCDYGISGSDFDADLNWLQPWMSQYQLEAIVNRMDTHNNWQSCGEYRLLFTFSEYSSHYLNFGARLLNPTPGDMRGCQNVIEFWRELPNLSKAEQARSLQKFFYEMVPGSARPAIAPEHFTGSDGSLFSIRAENPSTFFKALTLENYCNPNCRYWWRTVPSRDSPFGLLFNPNSTSASEYAEATLDFQQWFPQHLDGLLTTNLAALKNNVAERFNAAQTSGDYLAQFGDQDGSEFHMRLEDAVRGKQNSDGSPVQVEHILERVTVTSCTGCHSDIHPGIGALERADGTVLHAWPPSNGIAHVRRGGKLSPALREVFLPGRQVLFNEICEQLDALTD
jgi:hypothetical protein